MGEDGGSDRSDTSKGAACVSECRVSKAALQREIKDVRKILSDILWKLEIGKFASCEKCLSSEK